MASTPAGLILQHGPTGPPGVLGDWLRRRGHAFAVHRTWEQPLPDDPGAFSFVASLGSQHSPAGGGPPWVAEEVAFLGRCVDAGVPVLGLCFGGQALAAALGAGVGPAARGEVGWLTVDSDDHDVIPPGPWLQFHWDVFATPPGAPHLARSATGPAAFAAGPHLGLQFHPEATPEIVDGWAQVERARLAELGTTPEALLAEGLAAREQAVAQAERLFDAWYARAGC
jgi:GMP synthase-like glutamine amidotransferase